MATKKTRAQLRSFFKKGDRPTQAQFADFIESVFNILDDGSPMSACLNGSFGINSDGSVQGDATSQDNMDGTYTLTIPTTKKPKIIFISAIDTDALTLPPNIINFGSKGDGNLSDNQCVGTALFYDGADFTVSSFVKETSCIYILFRGTGFSAFEYSWNALVSDINDTNFKMLLSGNGGLNLSVKWKALV